MADLRRVLGLAGCDSIETYIQSGNALFVHKSKRQPELQTRLEQAIAAELSLHVPVHLLSARELLAAFAHNPWPDADTKSVHCYFLSSVPDSAGMQRLEGLLAGSERIAYGKGVCYLHAPDGIGRSRTAGAVERTLSVQATARNWRTVSKLAEMIKSRT